MSLPSKKQPRSRTASRRLVPILVVLMALALLAIASEGSWLEPLGRFIVIIGGTLLLLWALIATLRVFLWRVSRRLAFTYFLLGVLPIPLVLALLVVGAYLLSGFFLGHVYRTTVESVHRELLTAATTQRLGSQDVEALPLGDGEEWSVTFARYEGARRIGGDSRAPSRWPSWLEPSERRNRSRRPHPPLIELAPGQVSLAAAAGTASSGVVAFLDGDLERLLRQRSRVWIELFRHDDPRKDPVTTLSIFGEEFVLQPLSRGGGSEGREAFLQELGATHEWLIIGFDLAGPLRTLEGEVVSPSVSATLSAPLEILRKTLFPASTEVDTLSLVSFILPAFLLFDIYAVAVFMALFMIVGLSRAVNRLSRATQSLQAGDFSVRIPLNRKDQVGALQASFNDMARNLERLVAQEAKKELLERELEIAQELQQSLLPNEVDCSFPDGSDGVDAPAVEFATYFEPSAAIGGDYFDILELGQGNQRGEHLAVAIADVSGHGISAGLRMAMLKAALWLCVEDGKAPVQILAALDRLVRSSGGSTFVTATLGLLDSRAGTLDLTNAGHPPTYHWRNGAVEAIELPSPPLGVFKPSFAKKRLRLQPADMVVWLSDGLIEAEGNHGPFGYEAVTEALAGPAASAAELKERLLDAVHAHTGGQAPEDDRTLVVMRWQGLPESSELEEARMNGPRKPAD